MSTIESGDRPLAVTAGGAAVNARFTGLAVQDAAVAPPYAFDEFQKRSVRRQGARAAVGWSVAATVATLGLVLTLALVTGREGPGAMPGAAVRTLATSSSTTPVAVAQPEQSALVDLGQFAVTSEMEDNIAWFDAALSESRVHSASPEHLRQLETARNQLADSLQKVSYAHSFLGL